MPRNCTAGLQELSGLLGNPAGLPSWCHAFSGDVTAAEAAPAAPTPPSSANGNRPWPP